MAITPYLYYRDVRGALKFLSKAFGFRKVGRVMADDHGFAKHAEMELGNDQIMIGSPGPDYRGPKALGQTTQCIYVTIKGAGAAGVDRHFARAKKAGAVVVEEPLDTPYGHRRYGVKDPEGHEWYFATELKKKPVRKRR